MKLGKVYKNETEIVNILNSWVNLGKVYKTETETLNIFNIFVYKKSSSVSIYSDKLKVFM